MSVLGSQIFGLVSMESCEVLAGVGVRMSKYPYMDICDITTDRETERQSDRQTDRQTDKHTERQTD